MSRPTKSDSTDTPSASGEQPPTSTPASPPPVAAVADTALYEPYPGAHFFHGGRNSPIVQAMARRLAQEGHWESTQSPGPDWTRAHKRAFAALQRTLRPKEGGDVSGIPDEVAWDRLQVPRVSPRTGRES